MNNALSEFWNATWSAWRSGQLSSISPGYADVSACEYNDFIKKYISCNNPAVISFFTQNPPLQGEFLISFSEIDKKSEVDKKPELVITSQRLWMYNIKLKEYLFFNFSEILQMRTFRRWNSFKVSIKFKDNSEQIYKSVSSVPTDAAVDLIIMKCNTPDGWKIDTMSTISQQEGISQKSAENKIEQTRAENSKNIKSKLYYQCTECGTILEKDISIINALKNSNSETPSDSVTCKKCNQTQKAHDVYSGKFDLIDSDQDIENILSDSKNMIFIAELKKWVYKGKLLKLSNDYKERRLFPVPGTIIKKYLPSGKFTVKSIVFMMIIGLPVAIISLLFSEIIINSLFPIDMTGSNRSLDSIYLLGNIFINGGFLLCLIGVSSYVTIMITLIVGKHYRCRSLKAIKTLSIINIVSATGIIILVYYLLQSKVKFYNFSLSHFILISPKVEISDYIILSVLSIVLWVVTIVLVNIEIDISDQKPYCENCNNWYIETENKSVDPEWDEAIVNAVINKDASNLKQVTICPPDSYPRLEFKISCCPNCSVSDMLLNIRYSTLEITEKDGKEERIISNKHYLKTLIQSDFGNSLKEIIFANK